MNLSSNIYDKLDEYNLQKKEDYSFSLNNRPLKSTGASINNELNTENETIQILKSQNKRMLDLTNELERKEQLLNSMQQQLTSCEAYKMQADNYKRQVAILEEKLNLFKENEHKSDFYSQQLKNVSETENRLRNQLISKDKIIYDYDKTIKENEKTISQLRKQSLEKEEVINSLKQQINECNSKARNITSIMEGDLEEGRKIREENERRINDLFREKQKMEEKTTELIDIIKQQSKELNEYNVQCQLAEKDKKVLVKQNQNYQIQLDELMNNQCTLKEQMLSLKELKMRLSDCEEKNGQLLAENERIVKSNTMLQRTIQVNIKIIKDVSEKYNDLKNRYSGDNQPEKLRSIIDSLEKDLYSLKQNNDNISKVSKHNESRTLQLEGDLKDFMKGINQELKNIITWVDNYLVNSFERNTDIPDPSSTTSQFIKNNTYIESLKGSLLAVRKGLCNELTKSDVVIKELRKENSNLQIKNEGLGKEVSSLKNEILEKIDEIYKLNQELQKYANEITCVQKQEYKVKNEFYDKIEHYNKFVDKIHDKLKLAMNVIYENPRLSKLSNDMSIQMSFNDNKQVIIDNLLSRYFEIFNNLNNEYENTLKLYESYVKYKAEVEKLRKDVVELKKTMKEDNERFLKERTELNKKYEKEKNEEVLNLENSLKNNQEKMKQILVEKDELIDQLQMENSVIRSKLELLDKNFTNYKNNRALLETETKEKYEKLQESYKIIDKKYSSLMREIELKEIQIKSQESLLQRREKEIEELRRNDNSRLDQTAFSKKLQLNEIEKEKLVKENLNLMNMNSTLSNQFKTYKEQIHNSISSNIKISRIEEDTMKEYEDRLKNLNMEIMNKDNTINQQNHEINKLRTIQIIKDDEIVSSLNNSNNCINIRNADNMKGTIMRKKK